MSSTQKLGRAVVTVRAMPTRHSLRRCRAVSSDGLNWLRAEDDEAKQALVQRAALRPALFAKYGRLWGAARPLIPTKAGTSPEYDAAVAQLTADEGFSAKSAASFISVLYDTIEFAGLANDGNRLQIVPKVELSDQMGAKLVKACQTSANYTIDLQSRPESDQAQATPTRTDQTVTKYGMLYERFCIDEGDVSLTYPASLTQDGFENLNDYLHSFLRALQEGPRVRRLLRSCCVKSIPQQFKLS